MTDMTPQDIARAAYEVVVRLQPKLMSMLRRTCSPDYEEAWSQVVVERAPRVYELYDPETGVPIDAYFMRTMWFYARKWAGKNYRASRPASIFNERVGECGGTMWHDNDAVLEAPSTRGADEAREQLEGLMACLSEYDRWIVQKHALEGFTFEEMTKSLGMSRSAVCARYNGALTQMKVAADRAERVC